LATKRSSRFHLPLRLEFSALLLRLRRKTAVVERTGGVVLPGSLDGVNPAYHPDIFGNPAVASAYGFVQSSDGTWHVQSDWRHDRR
jgi:hypothetical protein